MRLISVGLDHSNSSGPIRELVAVSGECLGRAHLSLRARLGEGFILSTCNRTEAYTVATDVVAAAQQLAELLAEPRRLDPAELLTQLTVRTGDQVVEQLFGVAAGVRSMVVGEDQILAQLKAALASAGQAGALGVVTRRLGTEALACGKRVRAETAIGRHAVSVVSVALELARVATASAVRRVLVIGAGHTAELVLKHLTGQGGPSLTVINRTEVRGRVLADKYGACVRTWASLGEAITAADLVVTCTSASTAVLGYDLVAEAHRTRGGCPLVLVDLAVPHDVDPAVASLPGVRLIDIEHLESICREHEKRRIDAIGDAEKVIEEQAGRFRNWMLAREAAPTIMALVAHAAAIRDAEVERALARLPGLSASEQQQVRQLAARVVNKLMHGPLAALNGPVEPQLSAVAERLFGVGPGSGASAAANGAHA